MHTDSSINLNCTYICIFGSECLVNMICKTLLDVTQYYGEDIMSSQKPDTLV